MTILQKILHTSRPLEIADTEQVMARNFEKILGLKAGTVKVALAEHPMMRPCQTRSLEHSEIPHCHYAATISYNEAQKI